MSQRKSGMYCVNDVVAGECGPPFLAVNDGVALRMYRKMKSKEVIENELDFQLLKVGEWQSVGGIVYPLNPVVVPDNVQSKAEEIVKDVFKGAKVLTDQEIPLKE